LTQALISIGVEDGDVHPLLGDLASHESSHILPTNDTVQRGAAKSEVAGNTSKQADSVV
jgi:hypothetical protein